MADVITSTQAVLQEDVVSTIVQSVLTANAVMPGSVMDFTGQVGPGMDRLSIPRFGNFTVVKKTPGTAVDAATNAFAQDELLLGEHAVIQFLIERRADLQSKISIANHYLEQGAKDMAAQVDLDIITELNSGATAQSLALAGTLAKADVLDARKRLSAADVPMADRFAVVHPDEEADLLAISEFTRVDEAGGSMALRNGEIGKLFGFTFLTSSQQSAASVTFYHKTSCSHARQKDSSVDQDKDLANLADRWSIDMLYGQKALSTADGRALIYT
jgi:hypothetical protein